jgi:hypothetical protein
MERRQTFHPLGLSGFGHEAAVRKATSALRMRGADVDFRSRISVRAVRSHNPSRKATVGSAAPSQLAPCLTRWRREGWHRLRNPFDHLGIRAGFPLGRHFLQQLDRSGPPCRKFSASASRNALLTNRRVASGELADFTASTVRLLGDRAGWRCSVPGCNILTIGPGAAPDEVARTGTAAHIHSAALHGAVPLPLTRSAGGQRPASSIFIR